MKKTFVKFISLLLVLMIFVTAFVACADTTDSEDGTDAGENITAAEVSEEEGTTRYTADLPDADYKGEEFLILDSGDLDDNGVDWKTYDVYAEKGDKGEAINDAVYARNLYIFDKYNVKIAEKQSDATVLAEAKTAIKGGTDMYGAIMGNFGALANLADLAYLVEVSDLPYINKDAAWWDQNAVKSCSINNKLFYGTGDITVIDNDAIWVLYFNLKMVDDKGMTSPYDLIGNNEWTYEKFYEMQTLAGKPDGETGKYIPKSSTYGFVTTADSGEGLIYAAGISFAEKNEDDEPYLAATMEKLSDVVSFADQIMNDDSCCNLIKNAASVSTPDEIREIFQDGRALFYGEVLQCAARMRGSSTEFGLVTWPKFTTAQTRYYNFVHATAGKGIAVPSSVMDRERSSLVVEAMAAESKNTLTPAYYEISLTGKFLRDAQSVEMLDKILESTVFDLGFIYQWGNMMIQTRDLVNAHNSTKLSSTYTKFAKAFEKAMKKTVDKY